MSSKDITKYVLSIHRQESLNQLLQDTVDELAHGVPASLIKELNDLKKKIDIEDSQASNVVHMTFAPPQSVLTLLGETQLLAAAGQQLDDWFKHPIFFAESGITLDIRPVLGTDKEIDLYLYPVDGQVNKKIMPLLAYAGKSLHIALAINHNTVLEANLYVDEEGIEAEGCGKLLDNVDSSDNAGKVTLNIITEE
jgi:hypothetical protein